MIRNNKTGSGSGESKINGSLPVAARRSQEAKVKIDFSKISDDEIGYMVAFKKPGWKEARRVYDLRRRIECQQRIQQSNPPSSQEWQDASAEIKFLVTKLTGVEPKDACGRQS